MKKGQHGAGLVPMIRSLPHWKERLADWLKVRGLVSGK
jgi:hypothetical protein